MLSHNPVLFPDSGILFGPLSPLLYESVTYMRSKYRFRCLTGILSWKIRCLLGVMTNRCEKDDNLSAKRALTFQSAEIEAVLMIPSTKLEGREYVYYHESSSV